MTAVQVYTELLVLNTRGGDEPDAGAGTNSDGAANGVVCSTAADGWVVNPPASQNFGNNRLIFRMTVTTAATFVFKAGDRYPAQRADLGDLSITMATNDTRFIVIEASRFLQNNGTILVTATNTTDSLTAEMLPISG